MAWLVRVWTHKVVTSKYWLSILKYKLFSELECPDTSGIILHRQWKCLPIWLPSWCLTSLTFQQSRELVMFNFASGLELTLRTLLRMFIYIYHFLAKWMLVNSHIINSCINGRKKVCHRYWAEDSRVLRKLFQHRLSIIETRYGSHSWFCSR